MVNINYKCLTSPGLSNSHIRRLGLTNLSPGVAPFAPNYSLGLAWPYLTFHWTNKKYDLSICIYISGQIHFFCQN